MLACKLNDRVLIQHKTIVRDSFGQEIETWVDFAKLWANVRFMNGKEFNNANKENEFTNASVRIRFRLDITPKMRVVFRNEQYNIKAVLPDSNKIYVDLAVIGGVNDG